MPPLYAASVPVFRHYLGRIRALVEHGVADPDLLKGRLAPDMFSGGEQFATAIGFTLRTTFPLADRSAPDFPELGMDAHGLTARANFAERHLVELDPAAFEGAETRRIRHRAGFAELDQSGADFLHLFGLPNFYFHLTMGFAVLRHAGVEIGKSDFDALHDYPQGFRF